MTQPDVSLVLGQRVWHVGCSQVGVQTCGHVAVPHAQVHVGVHLPALVTVLPAMLATAVVALATLPPKSVTTVAYVTPQGSWPSVEDSESQALLLTLTLVCSKYKSELI
jgi:hypothetical protein